MSGKSAKREESPVFDSSIVAEAEVRKDQFLFRLGLLSVSVPIQGNPKRIHP